MKANKHCGEKQTSRGWGALEGRLQIVNEVVRLDLPVKATWQFEGGESRPSWYGPEEGRHMVN